MNQKRILIVHNYYQIPGGEDSVVANEKKMLEDNGHKVFMYTRHNNEILKFSFIDKLKFPFKTIYSYETIKDIKKIIKKYQIDIVHVHNTFPLISPSVYKAAKACRVKVVQTVHNFRLLCPGATFYRDGNVCEECVNNGLYNSIKNNCYRESKLQTILVAIMLKFNRIIGSYDKVDNYIALTDFNKEKLSNLISKNKISIKPNFSEKSDIEIVPIDKREYFMFLGRLDKLKGINKLIEDWKYFNDKELVIVGTGPEEEWIKNFIKKENINNIKILGFRNKEEAMRLLSKAKALLVPSTCYEGFPMTIVEALSLSVPIISRDIGNISDIGKQTGGVFNDDKELLNILNNITLNSEAYRKAEEIYLNQYNIESNYLKLISIYEE